MTHQNWGDDLYPKTHAAEQRSAHPDESFKRYVYASLVIAAACIALIGVIVVVSDQPARRAVDNACAVNR